MKIVVFESEKAALAKEKEAWVETVKRSVAMGEVARDSYGVSKTDISADDDSYIADMVILGHVNDRLRMDNGTTVRYAEISKAYGVNKWFFPVEEGLIDLKGCEVLDSVPPDWIEYI